jgi:hypothetical protein
MSISNDFGFPNRSSLSFLTEERLQNITALDIDQGRIQEYDYLA